MFHARFSFFLLASFCLREWLLRIFVLPLQLRIHHPERVIGDAERGKHLLFGFLALAMFDSVMADDGAARDSGYDERSRNALEPDHARAVLCGRATELKLPAPLLSAVHHLPLKA
jgi:hypothetical protein